ncbi:hypothetical protein AB1Y20_012310 [Prymnesium parvum]|uniref:Uncharacterized protein n=1 Tax=Prymnesium parvum TaxID=97485 RepID=A0AB34IRP3_PRYPA
MDSRPLEVLSADAIYAEIQPHVQLEYLREQQQLDARFKFQFPRFKKHLLARVQQQIVHRAMLAGQGGAHVVIDDIQAQCFLQSECLRFMSPKSAVVFSPFARVAGNLASRCASGPSSSKRSCDGVVLGFVEWFIPAAASTSCVLRRDELDQFAADSGQDLSLKVHDRVVRHFQLSHPASSAHVQPHPTVAGEDPVIVRGDDTRKAALLLAELLSGKVSTSTAGPLARDVKTHPSQCDDGRTDATGAQPRGAASRRQQRQSEAGRRSERIRRKLDGH